VFNHFDYTQRDMADQDDVGIDVIVIFATQNVPGIF
jgi:hypothetical protein